jgi:hypothetical protein
MGQPGQPGEPGQQLCKARAKLYIPGTLNIELILCTDRNIMENSYFPDFLLWEYRITFFNEKLCIKGSNSVLPERDIREMFY